MRTPTASCLWPEGSLTNKAILVPAALLISAFLPGLITPLLMPDGFLCFEGVENLAHKLLHGKAEAYEQLHQGARRSGHGPGGNTRHLVPPPQEAMALRFTRHADSAQIAPSSTLHAAPAPNSQ